MKKVFKKDKDTAANMNKKPLYKRPWFIAVVVVLLLGMGGVNKAATSEAPRSTPKENQEAPAAPENLEQTVDINKTLEYQNSYYTVSRIEYYQHPRIPQRKDVLVIYLTIQNKSEYKREYSSSDFGIEEDYSFFPPAKAKLLHDVAPNVKTPVLDKITLKPGEEKEVVLCKTLNITDTPVKLCWGGQDGKYMTLVWELRDGKHYEEYDPSADLNQSTYEQKQK